MSIDFTTDYHMTIDGKPVFATRTLEVFNPATATVIATVPDASREQLDQAVAAARRAFPAWASTPVEQRQELVRKIGERLMQELPGFAQLLTREQGKPIKEAGREIGGGAFWFSEFAKMAPAETIIEDTPEHRVEVRHVPIGVVGAIVPWNFPVLLAVWKLAPALIAGNTIVLKPSPFTPLTTLKLGELMNEILPAGVMNVITGGDELGPWITAHPDIDKVSFTGSTATGRRVMASGARNLKRLTLELGGNDAAIVLPDVDIETTAQALFWGAFTNNAQFCLAIKRLYIHEDIYEPLTQALVTYAKTVKVGDGSQRETQLGPVQNRVQLERLKALLADIKKNDQELLLEGEVPDGPGYFFPITLVDNPPDESRIVVEEPFGPILPLLKYRDIDEVVARANTSEFGLGGSVWGKDLVKAQAIAERLQTGKVWINEIHLLTPHTPLAGHKQSGIGVENGSAGLHEYTNLQTISIRRKG